MRSRRAGGTLPIGGVPPALRWLYAMGSSSMRPSCDSSRLGTEDRVENVGVRVTPWSPFNEERPSS